MLFILVIVVVVPILGIVYLYQDWFRYRNLNLPGPKPIPFVGNLTSNKGYDILRKLLEFKKEYGRNFKIHIGPQVRIITSCPLVLESIMGSPTQTTKSPNYVFLKTWLGQGLIVSGGAKWKQRRKLITPAFHFKILEDFMSIFNSNGRTLIECLKQKCSEGGAVDIFQTINLYSLDVICETSMGVKINALKNENVEYVTAVHNILHIINMKFFSFWERNDLLFRLFSPSYAEQERCLNILRTFTDKVIVNKQNELNNKRKNSVTTQEEEVLGIKKRKTLVDTLINSENAHLLSLEDIREEIDTFMFAGHDTTTTAISFLLYELAHHPEVQDKLYNEIHSFIDSKDAEIATHQMQEMKYLDMVIKEGQRRHPTVPLIERLVENNMKIGNVEIPANTIVSLFIYGLHHDPELYPEPTKFIPERFLPEAIAQRSSYAYVPFSAGLRNCIGQKFALQEMKLVIIKVLLNFKLEPVPGFEVEDEMVIVTKSRNGIFVKLRPRN